MKSGKSSFLTRHFLIISICIVLFTGPLWAQGTYNILDYGAVSNGKTLCTEAIQKAVNACGKAGGGTVTVPPGIYLTGPVFLRSHVNFHVSSGATLLAHQNIEKYPVIEGRWEGIERKIYASLITGMDLENVSITGRGTLNGQGKVWWDGEIQTEKLRKKLGIREREPDNPPGSALKYPRPRMINLYRCENVLIRDLNFKDSPSWTIHPVYCRDITVDNITINQPFESPNTDGVNPDSCQDVRIINCYIDCGDDCVTIKSGYNEDGRRVGIPCENVTIANCIFLHGHGGVVIGSETSGDVRNVTITNCIFDGTMRGLRIKTARRRGAVVEHIRASNLVMRDVKAAFSITKQYTRTEPQPVNEGTPRFHDFHFSNIDVSDCEKVAEVIGLEEMNIRDLRFTDVHVNNAKKGFECEYVDGIALNDFTANVRQGAAFVFQNTENIELHRVSTERPRPGQPVITLEKTENVLMHACSAPERTTHFLKLIGDENKKLTIRNNYLDHVEKPVERPFISWGELKNPIYSYPTWSTKDACMIHENGWFYVFFSAFFFDDGEIRSHISCVRTHDFIEFSDPLFIWDGQDDGWTGMCSPNISKIDGKFILTYNSWGDTHPNGMRNQGFYAESDDLMNWDQHKPIARNLTGHASLIDVAVAKHNGYYYVVWQDWKVGDDKVKQNRVARSRSLDGDFELIGDGYLTFLMQDGKWNGMKHENWEFLMIDGVWHVLSTDYSPHEPYLYRISGNPDDPMSWKTWVDGFAMHMPRENFNTKHWSNAGFLADWRDHDGYYYMLYAGSTQSKSHAGRGDNKLALSRSKDLKNWSPAGQW